MKINNAMSWRELLKKAFHETGDDFTKMKSTMTAKELDHVFYVLGSFPRGPVFTAWGENYVYFPVFHDESEYVGYVPRNECEIKTRHYGTFDDTMYE